MNKNIGSFEETIASVHALSEHRKKRGNITRYDGRMAAAIIRKRRGGLLDIDLAVRMGWCTPPRPMSYT
jgi:hypothetical protein